MVEITHFIESFDLRGLHWAVSFIGVMLCVYAMQTWGSGVVAGDDQFTIVNWMRRIALWLLALAFLWDLSYADIHSHWQPWPPDLAAIMAVDIFLGSALLAGYMRKRAQRQLLVG